MASFTTTTLTFFVLAAATLIVIHGPPEADAVCCAHREMFNDYLLHVGAAETCNSPPRRKCPLCGDCIRHGSFSCCGCGACNIFCCNCDGGRCIAGKCFDGNEGEFGWISPRPPGVRPEARSDPAADLGEPMITVSPNVIFKAMDADSNKQISLDEFGGYIKLHSNFTKEDEIQAEFKKMCSGGKDYLVLKDIDKDAVEV